jgi:NADPH:quinone reductase-like Zn-dependent oxidoreductase
VARELLEMIDQNKLALNISKIYELEDVGSAHRDLESQNTTGKIILKL